MIGVTTLTPIVVATGLSFCFKNTRGMGIVGVAVMAYFAPKLFLMVGLLSLFCYIIYKTTGGNS